MTPLLLLSIGIALIMCGSAALSGGSHALLAPLGLPRSFTSLLATSLAWSSPILALALQNSPEIAVFAPRAAIATIIVTLLAVLGLGAVFRPIPAPPRTVFRDGLPLIVVCVVVYAGSVSGLDGRIFGAALVVLWLLYLVLAYFSDRTLPPHSSAADLKPSGLQIGPGAGLLLFGLGVALMFFGSRFSADGSILMARAGAWHPQLVGMLFTSWCAAAPVLVFGSLVPGRMNVRSTSLISTAVFGTTLGYGIEMILHPEMRAQGRHDFDAPILLASSVFLLILCRVGWRITRLEGIVLIAAYAACLAAIGWQDGVSASL
jgi:cation:H+ antiporter